ncbi:Tropomodulin-2 [Nowakowskiella sp. JEL0407]|nr:Tropomodulin-2 [Nowakowskiella sp. JEL0407]
MAHADSVTASFLDGEDSFSPTTPSFPPRSSYIRSLSTSSSRSSSSRAAFASSPVLRNSSHGAPLPLSAISSPVRHVNPLLDELLFCLELLQNNDPSLTSLDLKDSSLFSFNHGSVIANALSINTHIKSINLTNVKLQTATAIELAEALRDNHSLESLVLDQNLIAPQGIRALADALKYNSTLKELRIAQQRQQFGTEAEQALADALKVNQTLVKFGGQIRDVPSRNFIDRAITRNKEIARKKRLAQQ